MALIECPECKRQMSDKALSCPGCGAPARADAAPPSAAPQGWISVGSPTPIHPDELSKIPVTPNPSMIAMGVLFIAAAAYLVFSFIPAHRPLSEGDIMAMVARDPSAVLWLKDHWMMSPQGWVMAWGLAIFLLVAGISGVVAGIMFRNGVQVYCPKCKLYVIGKRKQVGTWCPNQHYADISWIVLLVPAVLFIVGLIAIGNAL